MRQILSKLKYILATMAFVATTAMSSGGAVFANELAAQGGHGVAAAGNNGTIKIHEEGTPSGTESNDPKVCVFNVEGFGFDSGQTGYLMFNVQGKDKPIGTDAGPYNFGPADGSGYYASQYFHLDPGHYKATLYGKMTSKGKLQDEKAKSKVFKVSCESTTTEVTPTGPTSTEASCANPNITVTPPVIEGIIWTPSGSTTLQPGQSQTYTAKADTANGYVLKDGSQTEWKVTNDFDTSKCENCGCHQTVTPKVVKFTDACGLDKDSYRIPSTAHVKYYVNDSETAAEAGVHRVSTAGLVTVVAVADEGWTLSGEHEWSHDFTNERCIKNVNVPPVKFKDVCGTDNDRFIIPEKTGVEYRMNGEVVGTGDHHGEGTVTVNAAALDGYILKGKTTWTHTFKDEPCGGNGGGGVITPGEVSFKDITCEAKGSFTIPNTPGIVYKDASGAVLTAGEHKVSSAMDLEVKAYPENSTDVLDSWSHNFKLPLNCETGGGTTTPPSNPPANTGGGGGFVLGSSTERIPSGRGGELVNTGTDTVLTSILALLMVTMSLTIYAYRPKSELV